MKKRAVFASVGLSLLVAANILAADLPRPVRNNSIIHGGNATVNKAVGDTIDLMGPTGSGAAYTGDFESGWNGWTSIDATAPSGANWHVSAYNQSVPGNLAAWCGSLAFPSCNETLDEGGGYGNNWSELLEFRTAVTDPQMAATVQVTATLQYDVEPAEDHVLLNASYEGQLGYVFDLHWTGNGVVAVDETFTYLPTEFVDGTDVVITFLVVSDGARSDEDCMFFSAGACQLDDVTVAISQAGLADIVSFTDFQDGTLGDWANSGFTGVGDYAQIWSGLEDNDPCATNYSNQVAFVDDDVVVPGTGGSECINWCYGPSGFIVNTTGGLLEPTRHLENYILSPVMDWPTVAADGILYSFDVFVHEDLTDDSPGVFYTWAVRSADTDGSAGRGVQDINEQPFEDRNSVYFGGPEYRRETNNVSDLMVAGRDELQMRLGVWELGWVWGWTGDDGYPAPYFDNVSVKVFPVDGPVMVAKPENLGQDSFPERDVLDVADLGSLHVRFDSAIASAAQSGDSLVVSVRSLRAGGVLVGAPQLHYTIDANPVFDAFRIMPVSGWIPGSPVMIGGAPLEDQWAFDLPDSGTLFPGDVLHYYFRAEDAVGGDIQSSTLPVDLSGYGVFGVAPPYDPQFTVNALPEMSVDGLGGLRTSSILVWDDSGDPELAADLYEAMIGFNIRNEKTVGGKDRSFDFYFTNAAELGLGNGVGGRTSGASLAGYSDIIYRSGIQDLHTLSSGDPLADPGNDLGALASWFAAGERNLLVAGDGVASDLTTNQGADGLIFAADVLGVDVVTPNIRSFISNQASPLVSLVPGNPVFYNSDWYATGGCPKLRAFDGQVARPGAVRLAEFADPSGGSGAYSFSAATLNFYGNDNRIVTLPYDVASVSAANPASVPAPYSANNRVLEEVLIFFGFGPVGPVPEAPAFAVYSYPNPFNPVTRIEYSVSAPGHLSLKIYNLRGELVRTLVDAEVQTRGHVVWDGTDAGGAQVARGVYVYEARMGAEVFVEKMALRQ
ncbi:MAG: hypothetical protein QNL91_11760 [Candidatus Krumholzibacteria bacterium]|nr:hypothetical protein [Candidatus Krumholzibacteria bacterium]